MIKKGLLFALSALCLTGAVSLGASDDAQACPGEEMAEKSQSDKLAWRTDVQPALAQAKAEGKPAILYVGTDNCGACTKMVDETLTDARVLKALKGFVAIHADMTGGKAAPKLPQGVDASSMPSVLFVNAKGVIVKEIKLTGFIKADDFLPMLKKVQS